MAIGREATAKPSIPGAPRRIGNGRRPQRRAAAQSSIRDSSRRIDVVDIGALELAARDCSRSRRCHGIAGAPVGAAPRARRDRSLNARITSAPPNTNA